MIVTYDRSARGGAPERANGLISAFESRGDDVVVVDLPVRKPVYAPRHLPLWYLRPSATWRRNAADTFLNADLVVASRLAAAYALLSIERRPSGAVFVYDAHNDETRLAAQIEGARTTRLIRRMEDRAIGGFDVVWAAGTLDAASLARRHPQARIVNLPNGVGNLPDLSHNAVNNGRLFTYGSWTYPPNAAGLRALAAASTSTHAALTVFGAVPTSLRATLTQSAEEHQQHITWRFAGYEPNWQRMAGTGEVAIIPLWSGGGTKLRAAQLAAMGVPMVVTSEALSGLPDWFAEDIVVASGPRELIEYASGYAEASPLARRRLQERVRAELSWSTLLNAAIASSDME